MDKDMDKGKDKVLVKEYFSTGKNCAQSVLMVYADRLGITEEQAFAMAAGFGGGIARNGEVCGAVSGAVMALGLLLGEPGDNPDKAKEIVASKVDEFLMEFKKRQKSLICRELIDGIDLKTTEGQKEWADKNMHKNSCLPAVSTAVDILNDLV